MSAYVGSSKNLKDLKGEMVRVVAVHKNKRHFNLRRVVRQRQLAKPNGNCKEPRVLVQVGAYHDEAERHAEQRIDLVLGCSVRRFVHSHAQSFGMRQSSRA